MLLALCVGLLAPAGAVASTPVPTDTVTPVQCSLVQPDGSLLPVAAPAAGALPAADEICITAESLKVTSAPASATPTTHRRAHHRHARRHHHRGHHRTHA